MLGLGVPYRFVAKSEVLNMPFIGTVSEKMATSSFDRTNTGARRRAAQNLRGYFAQAIRFVFLTE